MRFLLFLLIFAPVVAINPLDVPPEVPEVEFAWVKKKIYVAINDNWESQMLKSELTRDWTKPSSATLSPRELKIAKKLNTVKSEIVSFYDIVFVGSDDVPYGLQYDEYPYVKIGERSNYESVDRQAFNDVAMSLLTMKWYCDLGRETHIKDKALADWYVERHNFWKEERKKKLQIEEEIKKRYSMPDGYRFGKYSGISISSYGDITEIYGFNSRNQTWEKILDGIHFTDTEAFDSVKEMNYFSGFHSVSSRYTRAKIFIVNDITFQHIEIDLISFFAGTNVDITLPKEPIPFMEKEIRPPWKTNALGTILEE